MNAPPEWFINSGHYNPHWIEADDYQRAVLAIAVCQKCPVIDECAAERANLENQLHIGISGVWGGVLWRGDGYKHHARYRGASPVDMGRVRVK